MATLLTYLFLINTTELFFVCDHPTFKIFLQDTVLKDKLHPVLRITEFLDVVQ
jgi:hypothetical protein